MNKHITKKILTTLQMVLLVFLIASCGDSHDHDAEISHGHDEHDAELEKGSHGGRLLIQDGFSLEVTIFERGVPPEFHIYPYLNNHPISPKDVTLTVELKRLGGKVDHIQFSSSEDYLRGDVVVSEPHSFEVKINASHDGKHYSWMYDNFEGRTRIADKMASEMGVKAEPVTPVILTETITLTGRVQTNPNKISRVIPRFPGVVKIINHELGDFVRAGEILATIQSNESLQDYVLKAPIDGAIIKRDLQIGETAGITPLFIIADHSELWVELDVFSHDLTRIKSGQAVLIETLDGSRQKEAVIDWVSPLAAHASQSVRARVVISNDDNSFRPGQFIRGEVTIAQNEVPLAVKQSAIQDFRDFKVVYAKFEDNYEVRMLTLGKQNKDWVEVLGGIEKGTKYVTANSYLVKADIEKSGASHDH